MTVFTRVATHKEALAHITNGNELEAIITIPFFSLVEGLGTSHLDEIAASFFPSLTLYEEEYEIVGFDKPLPDDGRVKGRLKVKVTAEAYANQSAEAE